MIRTSRKPLVVMSAVAGPLRWITVLVAIVVAANARVWWQLLAGKRPSPLREEPYVPVAGTAKA